MTYSYQWLRFAFLRWFDHKYCCCCRPKIKRDDSLFKNAKKKLNEEIDILEIVKKLRVYQFQSQIALKPHQRDLVNFFREYKIYDEDSQESGQQQQVEDVMSPRNVDDVMNDISRDIHKDDRFNHKDDDGELD